MFKFLQQIFDLLNCSLFETDGEICISEGLVKEHSRLSTKRITFTSHG